MSKKRNTQRGGNATARLHRTYHRRTITGYGEEPETGRPYELLECGHHYGLNPGSDDPRHYAKRIGAWRFCFDCPKEARAASGGDADARP